MEQRQGVSQGSARVKCTRSNRGALTVTMASLVCSMSEMTPSVMMRRTWYCEPSVTWAAVLWGKGMESLKHPNAVGQPDLLWDRWHLGMAKGRVLTQPPG